MLSPRQLKRIMKYQYGIENKYRRRIDHFHEIIKKTSLIWNEIKLSSDCFKYNIYCNINTILKLRLNFDFDINLYVKRLPMRYNNDKIKLIVNLDKKVMIFNANDNSKTTWTLNNQW
jgi:hypothetical protein